MHRTVAYVDWDTVRRLDPRRESSTAGIERVFEKLQQAISKVLRRRDRTSNFRVYWRVYHGWHQGRTKSPDRLLFEAFVNSASSRTLDNVSFSADYAYSGDLACLSRRSPVLDTLRTDRDTGATVQKMVDTMLACDLLHAARSKDYALHIVIANDDDVVPALFTAEAWRAQVILLHSRAHINQFLNLEGLVERMEHQ